MALQKNYIRLFIFCFAFLLGSQSITLGYFADDYDFAVQAQGKPGIFHIVTHNTDGNRAGGSWRPITALSMVGVSYTARAQHIIQLVLYAVVVLLVFELAAVYVSLGRACAAAILFAVLPIHAEPVFWVAARADLLAALFGLGAWIAWQRNVRWLSLVLFIASLLSKEVWILLPVVLLWKPQHQRTRWALYFLSVSMAWFAARFAITQYVVAGYSTPRVWTVSERIIHALKAFDAFMVGWPTFGTVQAALVRFSARWYVVVALFCIAACSMVWRHLKREGETLMVAGAALLAPILVLEVPFRTVAASVGEQRYWFAPSIAAVLIAVLMTRTIRRDVCVILFSVVLIVYARGFSTNLQLFTEAARMRDTVYDMVRSHDAVALVPDTYAGVHVWAAPYLNRARLLQQLPEIEQIPIYTFCEPGCYNQPLVQEGGYIRSRDARIIDPTRHGLISEVQIPKHVAFWDAATKQFLVQEPVEKPEIGKSLK